MSQPGTAAVAKVQKTFLIPDELARALDALSDSTGASFTKIATASLIQYLCSTFPNRDPEWMRLASALERGDLSLPAVLARWFQVRSERRGTEEAAEDAKWVRRLFDELDDPTEAFIQLLIRGKDQD